MPRAGSLSGEKPAKLGHGGWIPLFPMAGEAPQSVVLPGLWVRKADLSNMREVYKGQERTVEAVCSIPGGRGQGRYQTNAGCRIMRV